MKKKKAFVIVLLCSMLSWLLCISLTALGADFSAEPDTAPFADTYEEETFFVEQDSAFDWDASSSQAQEDSLQPIPDLLETSPENPFFSEDPSDAVLSEFQLFEGEQAQEDFTAEQAQDSTATVGREAYVPAVNSSADGYKVAGLENPLPFPKGRRNEFTVTGASAETRYPGALITGDGKWSPYCWAMHESKTYVDLPSNAEKLTAFTSRTFGIMSKNGIYNSSGTYKIDLYFRLFTWNGTAWTATSSVRGVVTTFTSLSITPTPMGAARTEPFVPTVNSTADGYRITGLSNPLSFPAGANNVFQVTGASSETRYGSSLIVGDGKWSPYCWTMLNSSEKHNLPDANNLNTAYTTRDFSIRSASGIYNTTTSYTISIYFRLFTWNGSSWSPTNELKPTTQSFTVANITPTPTGGFTMNTPTPTPTPFYTATPVPTAPASSITLNLKKVTLYAGAKAAYRKAELVPTIQNLSGTVQYTTSDKGVATVSKTGVISAKSPGTCTVFAYVNTLAGTYSDDCKVTVKLPTLKISPKSMTLKVGEKQKITTKGSPKGKVTYKSSDKSVASVSSKGKVKAKKKGSALIYVTCNKVTEAVHVEVTGT